MKGVKVSISLPESDVEFVDNYAEKISGASRSSVIRKALKLLRESDLSAAYEEAFREWDASGEAAVWDRASADGLGKRQDGTW